MRIKNKYFFLVLIISILPCYLQAQDTLTNKNYTLKFETGFKFTVLDPLSGFILGLNLVSSKHRMGLKLRKDFLFLVKQDLTYMNTGTSMLNYHVEQFCSQTYLDVTCQVFKINKQPMVFGIGCGIIEDSQPPRYFKNHQIQYLSASINQRISWIVAEFRCDIPIINNEDISPNTSPYPFSISLIYSFTPKK